MRYSFSKGIRLRKRREYLAVQRSPSARKVHGRCFLVIVAPRNAHAAVSGSELEAGQGGRVGITVSKKVGNAVARNRIKRWVREFVRLNPDWLPARHDVVVVAKRQAAELCGFATVESDLSRLRNRLLC